MAKKILIFGNFPFNLKNEFIDTNHFALLFAKNGEEVDFVTPPAYFVDFLLPFMAPRYAVLKNYISSGIEIEKNLIQYTPLSFLPIRNKLFFGSRLNLSLFSLGFKLSHISKKEYDICITSQGFMLLFTESVRAKLFIYRYNDVMDGFYNHPSLLSEYENRFISERSPLILPVNERLAQHIKERYLSYNNIKILPNGVDIDLFLNAEADKELLSIKKKKAVFCGGIDFWVDIDLILEAARTLKEVIFIIIGPDRVGIDRLLRFPNILYLGPKKYEEIPSLIKACDIGIIPFKKERLTEFVEKPLKYYEYLAAGLPVVATGLQNTKDKNPYFKNLRDNKLFIEVIQNIDIMSKDERIKITDSVRKDSWKEIFMQMESIISEERSKRQ